MSEADAVAAATFVIDQGSQRNRWVYAGADGVLRVVDKPADADTGTSTLTASYLDNGVGGARNTRARGEHSITLVVK
jgi:hypothetical protein